MGCYKVGGPVVIRLCQNVNKGSVGRDEQDRAVAACWYVHNMDLEPTFHLQ